MRAITKAFGLTLVALLLHGCGGNGGAGGGLGATVTDRVLVVRVSDANTRDTVSGVEVVVVTDTRTLSMQRVVAGQASDPARELPLSVARILRSDLRAGDFVLRGQLTDAEIFRGLWVRVPAGYTAVVRHVTPDNAERVKQMPPALNRQPECLVASNLANRVDAVFGKGGVFDFGTIFLYPNDPKTPPPGVDENCP
ncbi:MAG: hypothetical protein NZ843_05425 [Fimbriimonadales bacterium]|nr:hypothetical protein [Fimbriimonadales bacterium]